MRLPFIGERKPYRGFLIQSVRLSSGGRRSGSEWVRGINRSHVKLWDADERGNLFVVRWFLTQAAARRWCKGKRGNAA